MDIQNLTDKEIEVVKSILREYPNEKCNKVIDLLNSEKHRRQLPSLQGEEILKKFLLKYVRLDLPDGLGSYEVWKVKRIDDLGNKTYILYPEKPIVSNVDGVYSIDTYLDEVTIETNEDLKKFTVISKEEYDSEFSKAIEYYMSLKKD